MKFTKMHGTGNDYVFVNCFNQEIADPAAVSRKISDRHTGIGADGLILICPSSDAAARMIMYNADGSPAQMCGNGLRCVAKFVFDNRIATEPCFSIETDDGIKSTDCTVVDGKVRSVRIDMGVPRFAPTDLNAEHNGAELIDHRISINGREYQLTCVSMGNPHAVIFRDSLTGLSLADEGPLIERHEIFRERINVHFVQVQQPDRVRIRTWERGSGHTLACGTGAAAVCVAGARTGRTERLVVAQVDGGELKLTWSEDDHVFKEGPAVEVFRGEWCDHS